MRKIQFSNVFFDSEPFYQQILDPGTGGIARIPGREGEQTTLGAGADYPRYLETEYPLFER